jgi:hypothetical protein
MATTPQSPRAPVPPPPPRSGNYGVTIALLILGFIVLFCGMAIWVGFRVLTRGVHVSVNDSGGANKEVSIKTPFGGIEVNKDVSAASLGIPMYPGATRRSGHDDASVNMNFGDNMLRLTVAKFHSSDSFDRVKSFYEDRLTAEAGKFTLNNTTFDSNNRDKEEGNFIRKDREGKTVYEIKRHDSEKVVAIKDEGDGTSIDLVRISHGKEEDQAN